MAGITINPFLKNFFFQALKARKQYKDLEKAAGGKIGNMAIIITSKKMFIRMKPEGGEDIDKPFTPEEMESFCKAMNISAQSVKESKHTFILFNMQTKTVSFKQEKLDGTKKEFDL